MKYTDEQRAQISEQSKGKIVESLIWEPEDECWRMTFTDGSEMSLRLMAEMV
jgi:hypothetical protein